MIKKINELKEQLKQENLTEEEINDFVEKVKPSYEFYEFMLKEYNKDQEIVDFEAEEYSNKLLPKYQQKLINFNSNESKLKFIIEMSGDIMKKYSEKYKYNKSEELKNSINYLMGIQFKNMCFLFPL
jgi:hypothetical protein